MKVSTVAILASIGIASIVGISPYAKTLIKDDAVALSPTPLPTETPIPTVTPTAAPTPTATPSATPIITPNESGNNECNKPVLDALNKCLDACSGHDCINACQDQFKDAVKNCSHKYMGTDPTAVPLHRVQ